MGGAVAALGAGWDRVQHTVGEPSPVDEALAALQAAVDVGDLEAAASAATDLRGALAAL